MKKHWKLASILTILFVSASGLAIAAPANAATPAATCASRSNPLYLNGSTYIWNSYNLTRGGLWTSWSPNSGACLFNGPYAAVFQNDGNFVVYKNSIPLWESDTYNKGAQRLDIQTDGNIVIYTAANNWLWQSQGYKLNTVDNKYPLSIVNYVLNMQSDGNLVEYAMVENEQSIKDPVLVPVWDSGTNGK